MKKILKVFEGYLKGDWRLLGGCSEGVWNEARRCLIGGIKRRLY